MAEILREPGFWVIAALVAFAGFRVLGAALARPHFKAINRIAHDILSDPATNSADRQWMGSALRDTVQRARFWVVVAAAPVLFVAGVALGIVLFLSPRARRKFFDETDPIMLDALERKVAIDRGLIDPTTGAFWKDPRRWELHDHLFSAQVTKSPLGTTWIALWVALPLLLIALAATIDPTSRALREIVANLSHRLATSSHLRRA
jgi:hypothetical protein